MDQYIDIVFDGPPSHESGRFVEVENELGHSISAGEWIGPEPSSNDTGELWRLRLKVKPGLNNLARAINDISTAHGFWPDDKERAMKALLRLSGLLPEGNEDLETVARYVEAQSVRNMGEMLMLATSELAEAMEEHRDDKPVWYHKIEIRPETRVNERINDVMAKINDNGQLTAMGADPVHEITQEEHDLLVNAGIAKPEGLAVELADCVIRCLDTLQSLGVDIDAVVDEKMRYNNAREPKHGKAY